VIRVGAGKVGRYSKRGWSRKFEDYVIRVGAGKFVDLVIRVRAGKVGRYSKTGWSRKSGRDVVGGGGGWRVRGKTVRKLENSVQISEQEWMEE
jgi:hypothetical protein